MDRTHLLLTKLCEDIEKQLKPKLHGNMEALIVGYLPQVWVFETEIGACSVFIDTEGYARVSAGADRDRDVTLRWRYEALAKVLESRNRDSIELGDYPDVVVHTDKGRAAFNYLKKEIGL